MTDIPSQTSDEQPNPRGRAVPLSLRIHPDPVLREMCHPVERFDSWLSDVLEEMLALMQIHHGIGLAAPQVGLTERLFVAKNRGRSLCMVNPVIVVRCGVDRMTEGCLSLPGMQVDVERDLQVEVQGFDAQGRKQRYCVEGLWARVVQHEIDHLNGVLICDKTKGGVTVTETCFEATEIDVGFHPDGYRIDKTASAMNRYTKWEILPGNRWAHPTPVCFHCLPGKGWIKKDRFNWEKDSMEYVG